MNEIIIDWLNERIDEWVNRGDQLTPLLSAYTVHVQNITWTTCVQTYSSNSRFFTHNAQAQVHAILLAQRRILQDTTTATLLTPSLVSRRLNHINAVPAQPSRVMLVVARGRSFSVSVSKCSVGDFCRTSLVANCKPQKAKLLELTRLFDDYQLRNYEWISCNYHVAQHTTFVCHNTHRTCSQPSQTSYIATVCVAFWQPVLKVVWKSWGPVTTYSFPLSPPSVYHPTPPLSWGAELRARGLRPLL